MPKRHRFNKRNFGRVLNLSAELDENGFFKLEIPREWLKGAEFGLSCNADWKSVMLKEEKGGTIVIKVDKGTKALDLSRDLHTKAYLKKN